MAEKDQEYAAMHFGFTAGAFADTIFNIGNEAIAAQLKTFKKEMQKKCPPENALFFDKAFKELTVRTEARGMQLNDKLKYVLETRVFNIPKHITVESDEQHLDFAGIDHEQLEKNLDEQIEETEKKIVSCEFARVKLEESIKQSKELADELENVKADIESQRSFASELATSVSCLSENLKDSIPTSW